MLEEVKDLRKVDLVSQGRISLYEQEGRPAVQLKANLCPLLRTLQNSLRCLI